MDEISRMEKILRGDPIEPITRLEKFCAKAAGTYTGDPLTPVTRLEWFLDQISGGGGGGETKSTFIIHPNTTNLGPDTYSATPGAQQFDAPEGIVYDKVWATDQFCSRRFFVGNLLTYHLGNIYNYLRTAHWPNVENIISTGSSNPIIAGAFNSNAKMVNLILPSTTLVTLQNTNAFTGTPFASGGSGGTLWVPSALKSSYQSASNWSTILGYANNQIKDLEGSVWV